MEEALEVTRFNAWLSTGSLFTGALRKASHLSIQEVDRSFYTIFSF